MFLILSAHEALSSFFPPFFSYKHHHVSCLPGICYGRLHCKLCKDRNITALGVIFLTCDILKCCSLTNYMSLEDLFLLVSKRVCGLRESWVIILPKV